MRPSWPPPRIPMVAPGRIARQLAATPRCQHFFALRACAPGAQPRSRRSGSVVARISTASSAAFAAPGLPIAKRPHRNTLRHLHNGQQRIDPLQHRRRNRHAQHRNQRLRCQHSGQMRRAAGSGNDHPQPARLGLLGIFKEPVRSAMRGDDTRLVRESKTPAAFQRQARAPRSRSCCPSPRPQ